MSMLARELAELCEARGIGVFTTADPSLRTIYAGQMPATVRGLDGVEHDVVEALMIIEAPSPPPHQYVDTEYPIFDFWYRSPHTDRAHAAMEQVFELFHRNYSITTEHWYIHFSQALGTIADVDRDIDGGKLLRLSIQFICRNLTHVS